MKDEPHSRTRYLLSAVVAALILLSVVMVVWRVDLSPKVESDFFFSTDDPQLQASERIVELFPSAPQILITASGENVLADEYLERLKAFGDELEALDGIQSVQSLVHGPPSPKAVPEGPLWSRLLLGASPRVSLLIASVAEDAGSELVVQVEEIVARHHSPGFALRVSGVPYVVELIRRHLERDLRVFSTAALGIFGLLIAVIYRSLRIVAGTLLSCLGACAVTLTGLHLAGKSIGLLTANIVTIVFVLTLSHIVFLTANWRRETGPGAVAEAVRVTFSASFWCMATTFLGFSSLLFVSAKPLRELGFAGAFGTAVAIAVAYGLYPAFLGPRSATADGSRGMRFPLPAGVGAVVGAAILTVIAALGLPKLDTDPDMLSYFAAGSEIRTGIELVDRNGGSSPLMIVAADGDGNRLDQRPAPERLAAAQKAFDEDPAVGVSLSLPLLLAEARRVPVAFLLSDEQIVDLLDTESFDHIASSFITPDRTRTLFFLRMHEAERQEPRRAVLDRLRSYVTAEGFDVELVGGLYELQAELGELVRRSLLSGLAGLLVLFLVIAAVVGRSLGTVLAMSSLVCVPILVLGFLGHFGRPLDVISSPAVNVAIALGIDSMIHLVLAVRRHRRSGDSERQSWQAARDELWQPIAGAMLILAAGFGIFGLSSFPPTQRFGLAVAGGTAAAAFMALFVLPWLATRIRATRAS